MDSSLGLWAGGCVLALVVAAVGCGKDEPTPSGPGMGGRPGMGGPGGQATAVRVAEVSLGAIDARTTYVAETRPRADVRLSAEVAGVVEAVHAELGDKVEAGQLLARIRGRTFSHAVLEAEASVAHAEASVVRAGADLGLAERERERARQLQARGALTRAELDGIEGRYLAAAANLELAKADEQQRRARLDRARIDISNTRITAPFAGAIAERLVDAGALVSPGAQLFRVVDSDTVIVRFSVPESDVARLAVGRQVAVEFDALAGHRIEGEVERVSPLVDPQTRTTPVEVLIESGERVRPGMFARVTVVLDTKDDARLVPSAALVRRQTEGEAEVRDGVFVLRGETAHFEQVDVGIRNRAQAEILRGVELGDRVVVAGHSELRDGGRVRLVGEEAERPESASGGERKGR